MSSLLPTGGRGFRLIEQNYASIVFSAGAASEFLFIGLFGGALAFDTIIGNLIILNGIVFSMALKFYKKEVSVSTQEASNTALWAFFALFAFVVVGLFVPQIQFSGQSVVNVQTFYAKVTFNLFSPQAVTGAFIFVAVLIPAAEEQFFRGFWGNLSLYSFKKAPGAGVVVGGMIFAVFHLAVYGLNFYTLAILALDGMTMIVVDSYATGNIFTSMLAHSLNNAIAFGTGLGIVGGAIPHAFAFLWPLSFAVVPSFFMLRLVRQGRVKFSCGYKYAGPSRRMV